MPGSVSDSYDPDFSTGYNRALLVDGVEEVGKRIDSTVGQELKNIFDVIESEDETTLAIRFTERELRIIRFCLITTWKKLHFQDEYA